MLFQKYKNQKLLQNSVGIFLLALFTTAPFIVLSQETADSTASTSEEIVQESQPDPDEILRAQLLADLKQQLAEKEKEAEELDSKARTLNTQIEDRQKQKQTLNNEISLLNSRIDKLLLDIKTTQNKISRTSLEIDALDFDILEKTSSIDKKRNEISNALRTLDEVSEQHPLAVLLERNSLSDFLAHQEYIASLERTLYVQLNEVKDLRAILLSKKDSQELLRENLTDYKERLSDQRLVTSSQKNTKSTLLVRTKNQESEYRKMLQDVNAKKEEIARQIFDLEEKISLTINPDQLPSKRSGVFIWPTEGKITQGYGKTSVTGFHNDFYDFHNGIDIGAALGASVKAAKAGVVVGVGDLGPYAYGKWIAIRHDNNLVTMYGHLSLVKVKQGQSVAQGQGIGAVGATGYSTGPHLHFTVYADETFTIVKRWYGSLPLGGSINPLDYL